MLDYSFLNKRVLDKTVKEWIDEVPIVESIIKREEVVWLNDGVVYHRLSA